jgi:beta-carotene hydroxylase
VTPQPSHAREEAATASGLFKAPRVAWGTIALFCGLLSVWLTGLVGGALGRVPAPLAVALSTMGAFAAFTVMHDASHQAIGRARWLSALLGHAAASILLVRFVAFQNVHLRHHRFTGDPARDPDRYSGEGPAWQLPLRLATADLHYYFEYDAREGHTRQGDVEAVVSAVLLGAVALALCASGHAGALALFWLLPARLALCFLAYSFDYIPHQRPHCRPASDDRYRASFVIEGRAATVLLLCQNYHLVHHLHPAVPFYRCAWIWRARREELVARGVRPVPLFARPRPLWGRVNEPERCADL